MVEEHCPSCGNEIYKPFKYCNACGWENEEADEKKDKKETKETKAKKAKKGTKDIKSEKESKVVPGQKEKPVMIKCKCGAQIKIESSTRPIKIECQECGRTGTLKGGEKPTEAESPEVPTHKKAPSKDLSKDRMRKKTVPPIKKGAMKPKGARKPYPGQKRGVSESYSDNECPECGTRLGMTGHCPNCGYRAGPSVGPVSKSGPRKPAKKGRKHPPPKKAQAVKPKKGICSKCNSKNLRFYDDGSGRCSNCGHEFRWDGGVSRMQTEEYKCLKCGDILEWIEQYKRWYCHSCAKYQ